MKTEEKTPNYSVEQVKIMADAAPLNLEKAKELGEQFGKSARSIIAKAKREGIKYQAKEAPAPKRQAPKKVDMVATISDELGGVNLAGLEKAPVACLARLLAAVSNADAS